jgi:hypothetical protein
MARQAFTAFALCACCTTALLADFSYEQSSKITGGAMAGMMKVAGAFSKQAREPMRSTVMVKGDRMATVSGERINVIDLNKETLTDIDLQKKTYAVLTFADMARALEKMSEKLKGSQADTSASADASFKVDVKNTGASRAINGIDAKQSILTVNMETTDKKTGNKLDMVIATDMWMAPSMPGYEEVRNFYMRMAQKMAWTPSSGFLNAMAAQQPGLTKGMAEASKEMAKLDGIPMLQIVRMGGAGTGMAGNADSAAAQQEQQQPPPPSVKEAAGQAATGAALGRSRLGGLAGGLGGLGRKKKQEEQPQAQAQPAPEQPTAAAAPPGTLMELTTELTSFSSAAVDGAKFEVPAGFKQVEHDMQKALK